MDTRIKTSESLSPSLKVLVSKLLKFTLIGIAILIALHAMGIGSSLTVFSGAIGLGIGFGMQRVFANLVSGIILLLDKSIKPGDVIAVKDTYGWVNTLGGRYVSVITRDGTEHLIPNELLITEYVENWTHTDNNVRLKIPVHVHYKSDVRMAIELCVEAARETAPRARSAGTDLSPAGVRRQRVQARDPHLDQRSHQRRLQRAQRRHAQGVGEVLRAGDRGSYPQRDVHVVQNETLPLELRRDRLMRPWRGDRQEYRHRRHVEHASLCARAFRAGA